jgi:hypothetical protein
VTAYLIVAENQLLPPLLIVFVYDAKNDALHLPGMGQQ